MKSHQDNSDHALLELERVAGRCTSFCCLVRIDSKTMARNDTVVFSRASSIFLINSYSDGRNQMDCFGVGAGNTVVEQQYKNNRRKPSSMFFASQQVRNDRVKLGIHISTIVYLINDPLYQ
jgi:hypothetical protein